MKIKVQPFPAVRSNRNSWSDTVKNYHSKMNILRAEIWDKKEEIIQKILSWDYEIVFEMKMPKSWSKKKLLEMNWKYHLQKPDADNLFKAFTDCIFYKHKINDSKVFRINCYKVWGNEWSINIL